MTISVIYSSFNRFFTCYNNACSYVIRLTVFSILNIITDKNTFTIIGGIIMEWTRESRYKKYSEWDAETLLKLQAQATASKYQMSYHIRPQSGLLNDPNGFSYFNDEYHVFYQSYPFGAVHGLKSWVHLTSPDLVHGRTSD